MDERGALHQHLVAESRFPRSLRGPFATRHISRLFHGRDMELAPVRPTFEELTANPTPEVSTAATSTSTAAATRHIGTSTPSSLYSQSSSAGLIPSVPTTPLPPVDPALGGGLKTWESFHHYHYQQQQLQQLQYHDPPSFLLQQHPSQKFYHHHDHHQHRHHTHGSPSWDGTWAGASQTNLHSYCDPSSPFDSRPLVEGGSDGGWTGKPGKKRPWKPGEKEEKRVCGVKRFAFWFAAAAVAFVVVVGVSVGVGVGVGLSGSPSSPTPTSTRAVPTPVATANPSASMSCPGNDRTLYLAPQNSQKKFLLMCGRDYHSRNGTQELYNAPASTLKECLELCAMQEGCLGAGWGRSGKVASGKPVCWLKGQLGSHHDAPLWSFLMLDDGSLGGDAAAR
ncbi:hypothetical protein VTJ83DRAFT_2535 [Remersonia thermophila]|uniref:Apple domain-containing protein n=1 Tax=Remersonia thermophila TaxID=72144 RepID=A0ABR4DKI0_9PEZI